MKSRVSPVFLVIGACSSHACSLDTSPIFARAKDAAVFAAEQDAGIAVDAASAAASPDAASPSEPIDAAPMPEPLDAGQPEPVKPLPEPSANADAGGAAGAGGVTAPEPRSDDDDDGVADADPTLRCSTVAETVMVRDTIVIEREKSFDGRCRRYVAAGSLAMQSNNPIFHMQTGTRLSNVVLGGPTADGIHTYGDVTLSNVVWEQISEDGLTIRGPGMVSIDGGEVRRGRNTVFAVNAASTLRISNLRAQNAGKLVRQDPGASYRVQLFIDHCDISLMSETIFRTDSPTSRVSMSNTRYSGIGGNLFIGVTPANISLSNNVRY